MSKAKLNPRIGGRASTLNRKTASLKPSSVPKPKVQNVDPVEQKKINAQKKMLRVAVINIVSKYFIDSSIILL